MIVGGNFKNISAQKLGNFKGPLKINNNTKIVGIEETKIPLFKNNVAKINFVFQTNYLESNKKIGYINLEGSIIYKGKTKKIINEWKKNKKLIKETVLPVMNTILRRCLIRSMSLAEEVALPPPSNLPVMKPKKPSQELGYIG